MNNVLGPYNYREIKVVELYILVWIASRKTCFILQSVDIMVASRGMNLYCDL
jgi:hypothetical protein